MATRPYPYDRWAKISHKQRTVQASLRALWDDGHVQRAHDVARALLGRDLDVQLGLSDFCSAAERRRVGHARGLALVLELVGSARPAPIWVELSHADAQALVDRTLGGDSSEMSPWSLLPLDELSRGALAYLAARVLAALGGRLVLLDVIDLPLSAAELDERGTVVWPCTLRVSSRTLTLRLFASEDFAAGAAPTTTTTTTTTGRELSELSLTLIARAGSTRLPLSAAHSLALGDVVVLDETGLSRDHDHFRGQVSASLPGSSSQIACTVCETGLAIEAFTRVQEPSMTTGRIESPAPSPALSDSTNGGPSPDFAADAAIELTVEVARFSLTVAELSRLRAGDVLVTGRRIGERVQLRVSGSLFAEGELVDVEGEVGVRLLSFAQRQDA
ncbi:MAG: FliM/FliN family flagellar motor switch protein [Polyangiales bacterium]